MRFVSVAVLLFVGQLSATEPSVINDRAFRVHNAQTGDEWVDWKAQVRPSDGYRIDCVVVCVNGGVVWSTYEADWGEFLWHSHADGYRWYISDSEVWAPSQDVWEVTVFVFEVDQFWSNHRAWVKSYTLEP